MCVDFIGEIANILRNHINSSHMHERTHQLAHSMFLYKSIHDGCGGPCRRKKKTYIEIYWDAIIFPRIFNFFGLVRSTVFACDRRPHLLRSTKPK